MLVVLTEMYCNKVNIQITQWDDFIQKGSKVLTDDGESNNKYVVETQ